MRKIYSLYINLRACVSIKFKFSISFGLTKKTLNIVKPQRTFVANLEPQIKENKNN